MLRQTRSRDSWERQRWWKVRGNVDGVAYETERQLWWCILQKVSAGTHAHAQARPTVLKLRGLALQCFLMEAAAWDCLYLRQGSGLPSLPQGYRTTQPPAPCPYSPTGCAPHVWPLSPQHPTVRRDKRRWRGVGPKPWEQPVALQQGRGRCGVLWDQIWAQRECRRQWGWTSCSGAGSRWDTSTPPSAGGTGRFMGQDKPFFLRPIRGQPCSWEPAAPQESEAQHTSPVKLLKRRPMTSFLPSPSCFKLWMALKLWRAEQAILKRQGKGEHLIPVK